jgi:hypothetical protein
LINIKNEEELKERLLKKFQEAKKKINFIKQDLFPFFSESNFVENFINNFDALVENFFKSF